MARLAQPRAQQADTSRPHTMNQVVIPMASARKPENIRPTGAASDDPVRKMPMTRPNFSSGVRFCMMGMMGALKNPIAAATTPMSTANNGN